MLGDDVLLACSAAHTFFFLLGTPSDASSLGVRRRSRRASLKNVQRLATDVYNRSLTSPRNAAIIASRSRGRVSSDEEGNDPLLHACLKTRRQLRNGTPSRCPPHPPASLWIAVGLGMTPIVPVSTCLPFSARV